jgi:hypothetical protein
LLTENQKVDPSIRDYTGESVFDFATNNGKQNVVAALAT